MESKDSQVEKQVWEIPSVEVLDMNETKNGTGSNHNDGGLGYS